MASRFGASSASQAYENKVRLLVVCLVVLILVLAGAIFLVAQGGENAETQPSAEVSQEIASSSSSILPSVSILMAATRIEEGTRIESFMFNPVNMDTDKVAANAVRAEDLRNIIGKFAVRLINANMPLLSEDLSEVRPLSSFNIPPGYRAVTIMVDARSGVEGFARPNSRVDVLWTYTENGQQRVATISRFVKVLAVAGETQGGAQRANVNQNQNTTVTLLVTEKDARKIELARTLGTLSLSLVGDSEVNNPSADPDAVTIEDLVGRQAVANNQPQEEKNDGVMYTTDPQTGRQLRYVLRKGQWSLDRSFGSGGSE